MSRNYIVNKKTKERYYINGCMELDPAEYEDLIQKFSQNHLTYKNATLPPRVDLRKKMTPIEQQGKSQSCVANALVGAYEYLLKQQYKQRIDISRLFLYYNAREKQNNGPYNIEDKGCHIYHAVDSLVQHGAPLETIWPFQPKLVDKRPDDHAYQRARDHQLTWKPYPIEVDLNAMRGCLAKGHPFVFGLVLFDSFHRGRKGYIPMPQQGESLSAKHSRHAMLAIGYDDDKRVFVVRNSWGTRWGHNGNCYIPYDYMTNPSYCSQVFAICEVRSKNNNNYGGADTFGASAGPNDDDEDGEGEEVDIELDENDQNFNDWPENDGQGDDDDDDWELEDEDENEDGDDNEGEGGEEGEGEGGEEEEQYQ